MTTLVKLFMLVLGTALGAIIGAVVVTQFDLFQCMSTGACNAGLCFIAQYILVCPFFATLGLILTQKLFIKRFFAKE